MATSAYTRARGQRASQMSSQSQSGGRCPAVHRCTLLGQHFHYAHLHCFLMNRLAGGKKRGRKEGEILLLAATKQVRSRLYHRGCFKVILSSWNINHTPTVKRITSIRQKQADSPLIVYSNLRCSPICAEKEYFCGTSVFLINVFTPNMRAPLRTCTFKCYVHKFLLYSWKVCTPHLIVQITIMIIINSIL